MLAENLLAELSQPTADTSSNMPVADSGTSPNCLTATSWIKKETVDSSQKTTTENEPEVNIGMTAAEVIASCKGLGW